MAVQKEIWENYIAKNLFKDDSFLDKAKSKDDFVLQGKVLHIPQSGGAPNIVKNRSSLPATINKRVDTDISATLDIYTSDPVLIENADKIELSYDKMDSVFFDHVNAISNTIGDNALINWAPSSASRILRINSTGTSNQASYLSGQTGTRKPLVADDLKNTFIQMKKDNLPDGEMYALMSFDMYNQLMASLSSSTYRDYMRSIDETKGLVSKLFGFNILVRSSGLIYDNSATPVVKAYGSAGAATDNDAVLCWHKDFVYRAKGDVKFFSQNDRPDYYGDVYSALVRFLAGKNYSTEKGILALVQQA